MSDSVIVRVAQGNLRGKITKTKAGVPMCSFQGVPYAKPPVGKLRFMAPQPLEPWTGVKDALEEGNICPQRHMLFQNLVGDEDCLFLNVYTPVVPTSTAEPLIPVMVWIHGGGFTSGSSNTDIYGPDLLIGEGVVFVSLNYRVGALGFLTMEEAGVSGNAGLKDQVAALRWIKQNISQFGGDPRNVTIFGESAGGASVQYHLLSPLSTGLFHRAISQSGSAFNWWARADINSARRNSFRLAEVLGSTSKNPREVLDFLQKQSAFDLVKSMNKTPPKETRHRGAIFPFVPIVESGTVQGEEIFLAESPITLLKAGRINHVPYVTGVNSSEGILMAKDPLVDPSMWKELDENTDSLLIPLDMNVGIGSDQAKSIAEKIKKFYFKDQPLSFETRTNYVDMLTDTWFGCGSDTTVKLHVAMEKSPVYYYHFSFDGEFGIFKRLVQIHDIEGVAHGDDLGYLFSNEMVNHDIDPNSPARITSSRMLKMWTNFAKTGNPTPRTDALLPVKWEPATARSMVFLDIGSELTLKQDRLSERMRFWEEVYKITGTVHDLTTETSKL